MNKQLQIDPDRPLMQQRPTGTEFDGGPVSALEIVVAVAAIGLALAVSVWDAGRPMPAMPADAMTAFWIAWLLLRRS